MAAIGHECTFFSSKPNAIHTHRSNRRTWNRSFVEPMELFSVPEQSGSRPSQRVVESSAGVRIAGQSDATLGGTESIAAQGSPTGITDGGPYRSDQRGADSRGQSGLSAREIQDSHQAGRGGWSRRGHRCSGTPLCVDQPACHPVGPDPRHPSRNLRRSPLADRQDHRGSFDGFGGDRCGPKRSCLVSVGRQPNVGSRRTCVCRRKSFWLEPLGEFGDRQRQGTAESGAWQ